MHHSPHASSSASNALFANRPVEPIVSTIHAPVDLLLDERLTPLERNAWLVFRARVIEDGISSLTSFEQMRPFLACKAGSPKAAFETVSRTITVLRLTRWIHLAGHRRDPLTGQVQSNLYAVHDMALPFPDICEADSTYLDLLERALSHDSDVIRHVAKGILTAIVAEPSHLARLTPALRALVGPDDRPPNDGPDGRADDATSTLPAPPEVLSPSPTSDGASHAQLDPALRTSTYFFKEVRTYRTHARVGESENGIEPEEFMLPRCLAHLAADQQRDVTQALQRLTQAQRQDVLNELEARSRRGAVRDVVAYLFGLIRRALAGEFRVWAGRQPATATPAPAAPPPPSATSPRQPVSPRKPTAIAKPERASDATAHACITQLRELLRMPDFRGLSTAPAS